MGSVSSAWHRQEAAQSSGTAVCMASLGSLASICRVKTIKNMGNVWKCHWYMIVGDYNSVAFPYWKCLWTYPIGPTLGYPFSGNNRTLTAFPWSSRRWLWQRFHQYSSWECSCISGYKHTDYRGWISTFGSSQFAKGFTPRTSRA